MSKSYIGAIGAFALSILISCQGVKSPSLSESIVWDTILRVDTLPLLGKISTDTSSYPTLEVKIRYIYPQNNDKLRRLIAERFFDEEFSDLPAEEEITHFISKLKEDYPSADDVEGSIWEKVAMWDHRQIRNISFVDGEILSIESDIDYFRCGAHGMNYLSLYSVNLNTMERIKEDDIFIKDSREKLAQAIQAKLMKQYKVQELDDLSKEAFFSPREIEPNENFMITPTGLRYSYNPYEIAPYAFGIIQVDLTWDEISHIIRPGSIIEKYL